MNAVREEDMQEAANAMVGVVEDPQDQVSAITTPAVLLSMAIKQGAGMETLERLMDLQDRHDAKKAKQAFNAAVAAFKKNPPVVLKNKENKQYASKYCTLDNLVNTVNESLAQHGLTVSWDLKQPEAGVIEVTCILTHVDGHSESVTMRGAPDKSGAKNPLQEIKSTQTYLKGATYEAVTGIASSEKAGVNRDDDGNKSGKRREPEPQQTTKATPNGGAWERQNEESQAFLQKKANDAKGYLKTGDVAGAVDFLHSLGLDADETAAIWTRFDSADRTAMKKIKPPKPAETLSEADRAILSGAPK